MSPSLAIVVPAGPGDSAWRGRLPELDAARALEIALVPPVSEPETPGALRDDGLAEADILLANLIVAYFNFVNRIALGLGVAFDPAEVSGYDV